MLREKSYVNYTKEVTKTIFIIARNIPFHKLIFLYFFLQNFYNEFDFRNTHPQIQKVNFVVKH